MKRLALITLSLAALCAAAKNFVAESPDYVAKSTRAINPARIERRGDTTAVTFDVRFNPNWWIKIDTTALLVDPATGHKYRPSRVEGLRFGEQFVMPASGRHRFTLLYAGVPSKLKEVDFIDGSWKLFGLRLDGKKAAKPEPIDRKRWKEKHSVPYPGAPEKIFTKGDMTVSGRISGFSPRLGIESMLFYLPDPLRGNVPVSAKIAPDGSFSFTHPIEMASADVFFSFDRNKYNSIYVEPGRNLEILIDWPRSLESDNPAEYMTFGGELGRINNELAAAPRIITGFDQTLGDNAVPTVAREKILANMTQTRELLRRYADSAAIHPHSRHLLDINHRLNYAADLLIYESSRRINTYFKKEAASLKEPLTVDFFEAVKPILADDPWIAAGDNALHVANELAFSQLPAILGIEDESMFVITETPGTLYADSVGAVLSPEGEKARKWIGEHLGDSIWVPDSKTQEFLDIENAVVDALHKSPYSEDFDRYLDHALKEHPSPDFTDIERVHNFRRRNEALCRFAGVKSPTALMQMSAAGYMTNFGHFSFNLSSPEKAGRMIEDARSAGAVTDPDLIERLQTYFATGFEKLKGYELPDTEGGRLMKSIIEPLKGKFVLVDFWATTCGPCRGAIEDSAELRKRNLENPNFEIIYVTSEGASPKGDYDSYAAANLQGHTSLRLTDNEHYKLADLFGINGIPRYVLFGPEGQVLDDNFAFHNLRELMKAYGTDLIR